MYIRATAACLVFAAGSAASAAVNIYGADASRTISTLVGGDRELNRMGFLGGATTIFTGQNFLGWDNGSLTTVQSVSGWTTPIARDIEFANDFDANPDRADNSSLFAGEAGGTGTLREVFGPFGSGYKNMSWVIDGEDNKGYTLDLFLAKGLSIQPDADPRTVEVSVLERNGNSDFRVIGLFANGSTTPAISINRAQTDVTGWTLDSLEINGAQQVSAVGISLDERFSGIIGIRIQSNAETDNGPDIIAVGTSAIPAPGAVALMGLAAGTLIRRRRNK